MVKPNHEVDEVDEKPPQNKLDTKICDDLLGSTWFAWCNLVLVFASFLFQSHRHLLKFTRLCICNQALLVAFLTAEKRNIQAIGMFKYCPFMFMSFEFILGLKNGWRPEHLLTSPGRRNADNQACIDLNFNRKALGLVVAYRKHHNISVVRHPSDLSPVFVPQVA